MTVPQSLLAGRAFCESPAAATGIAAAAVRVLHSAGAHWPLPITALPG